MEMIHLNGARDMVIRMYREDKAPSDIMRAVGIPAQQSGEFYQWFGQLMQSGALDVPPRFDTSAPGNNGHASTASAAEPESLTTQLTQLAEAIGQYQKAATDAVVNHCVELAGAVNRLRQQDEEHYTVLTGALGTVLSRLQGEVPPSVLRRIFLRGGIAGMGLVLLLLGVPFALNPVGTLNTAYEVWRIGDELVRWAWRLF